MNVSPEGLSEGNGAGEYLRDLENQGRKASELYKSIYTWSERK